jgi:hypothetical protein
MNVILQGDGKPFGVLEVDSRSHQVPEISASAAVSKTAGPWSFHKRPKR